MQFDERRLLESQHKALDLVLSTLEMVVQYLRDRGLMDAADEVEDFLGGFWAGYVQPVEALLRLSDLEAEPPSSGPVPEAGA